MSSDTTNLTDLPTDPVAGGGRAKYCFTNY